MATKQLRTVLEKGKTSLDEVDLKVQSNLHSKYILVNLDAFQCPVTGGAYV